MIRRSLAVAIVLVLVACAYGCRTTSPATRTQAMATIEVRPLAAAAQADVAGRLPHVVVFHDVMGAAQVAPLDSPLDVAGLPSGGAVYRGDLAYAPRERSLVVVQTSRLDTRELVVVGSVGAGLDWLSRCVRGCVTVLRIVDAAG